MNYHTPKYRHCTVFLHMFSAPVVDFCSFPVCCWAGFLFYMEHNQKWALCHADAHAGTGAPALYAALDVDARECSSQAKSAALAGVAPWQSCAGSLVPASLTTRLGPPELTAVKPCRPCSRGAAPLPLSGVPQLRRKLLRTWAQAHSPRLLIPPPQRPWWP